LSRTRWPVRGVVGVAGVTYPLRGGADGARLSGVLPNLLMKSLKQKRKL